MEVDGISDHEKAKNNHEKVSERSLEIHATVSNTTYHTYDKHVHELTETVSYDKEAHCISGRGTLGSLTVVDLSVVAKHVKAHLTHNKDVKISEGYEHEHAEGVDDDSTAGHCIEGEPLAHGNDDDCVDDTVKRAALMATG